MSTKSLKAYRQRLLADPEVKAAYDMLEEEYALARAIIQASIESGLTQKELANKLSPRHMPISIEEQPHGRFPALSPRKRLLPGAPSDCIQSPTPGYGLADTPHHPGPPPGSMCAAGHRHEVLTVG